MGEKEKDNLFSFLSAGHFHAFGLATLDGELTSFNLHVGYSVAILLSNLRGCIIRLKKMIN